MDAIAYLPGGSYLIMQVQSYVIEDFERYAIVYMRNSSFVGWATVPVSAIRISR